MSLDGNPVSIQRSNIHLNTQDSGFLLDLHFLRFRKQEQARKRYLCGVTTKGYFLLIQPNGRIVISSCLLPFEGNLTSAIISPVFTSEGYIKRLFITLSPGKIAVFTKLQLIRMYRDMSIDSDFTVYSHEGTADVLAWTRMTSVFESREVVIVAHNARSTLAQYTYPLPDEDTEVGLSDVLRASFFSVKSRFFSGSNPNRSHRNNPSTGNFRLLSEIMDPKRIFDKIIALHDLIATLDKAGRVWVLDSNTFLVIRMLKGYRGGEVAWDVVGKNVNLVVYLPARRLLDVWRMRTGLRVTRIRLPEEGRLVAHEDKAFFLTDSGVVYLFSQSEEGIAPGYFYDSSVEALTASARFQRDRDIVSSYTSRKDSSGLPTISVENMGLLLPLVLGEANRSGEEYLHLVNLTISKTETLLTHPNKLVIFKTIKADFPNSPDLMSLEMLLSALHSRKKLATAYCDIIQKLKTGIDVNSVAASAEVQNFLEIFRLNVSFDDEFVDAKGEYDSDKVTFESATYWTSWRHFHHMCSNPNSLEDGQNLSLILTQLLLCDLPSFERALNMTGKTRGSSVEMFFTWITHCDIKQLALMLVNPVPARTWIQTLLHDFSSELKEFILGCSRLPGVFVLLSLCMQVDSGSDLWIGLMKEVLALNQVELVFAAKGCFPAMTLKGLTGSCSVSRVVAQWELTEGDVAKILALESQSDSHIQEKLKEVLPERLHSQLNPYLYAIHRADTLLSASSLNASVVTSAFDHLSPIKDPLLLSAVLHHLYLKHIAENLHSAFEDVPGVSDLPSAVTVWLEALQENYQSEGSFLQINSDDLMATITGSWLDVKPPLLTFNLQYMLKVLVLSRFTPPDIPSTSSLITKVFGLTDSEVEELVYLNLPVQAITSDPEISTQLFTSVLTTHKEQARELSSLLTTDEESLKIGSIKRLLEEGNDVEADLLIEEVRDTLKLGEALYSVARMRVAYVVQVLQDDPKYGLLLSNFPRKLMTLMHDDTSRIQPTSPLAAKDLLSRAIKYMDSNLSVNYAAATELEEAYSNLYRLMSEENSQ